MTNKNYTQIKTSANKKTKCYTIRKYDEKGKLIAKYKTLPLSKEEFQSCSHNTENDWRQFLKSDDYILILRKVNSL